MANKKNNQNSNKKNEMANGTTTAASGAQGPAANSSAPTPQPQNNATPSSTQSAPPPALSHAPPTQRLSTSSNQSNSGGGAHKQQPPTQHLQLKKSHAETDKTQQNSANSATNQGYRGSGGAKDQRAREKEKNNYRGPNQQHHHAPVSQQSNAQNNRKKENKNRDHSSQSHRGGHASSFTPYNSGPVKAADITELAKPIGFPTPPTSVAPASPVVVEKLVQTDPEEKKEKKKRAETPKKAVDECAEFLKKGDPKKLDTVVAFQEHDKWEQVELMCELVSFMDAADLNLMANCIEGALRCYTNQMRPMEKLSNCPEPTASCPMSLLSPIPPPPVTPFGQLPSNSATLSVQKQNIMNTFNGNMTQPPPGLPPITTGSQMQPPAYAEGLPSSSLPTNKESSQQNGNAPSPSPPTINPQNTDAGNEEKTKKTNDQNPNAPPNTAAPSEADGTTNLCRQADENSQWLNTVRDVTSFIYTILSVCESTNRKSATNIADYVSNVIIREKVAILERIPNLLDKIAVTQDIGKIVAAIVYHPATPLEVKMKYSDMRETLRAEIDNLLREYYTEQQRLELNRKFEPSERGVGREEEEGEETDDDDDEEELLTDSRSRLTSINYQPNGSISSSAPPPAFFVTRFIGRHVEKNENAFLIEIHWSDGDRTFTQRTRDQLKAFQHRLLDEFGQQRSEKALGMSTSSFDDESKKLSTSTSTMETNFAVSGERIVPRLPRDATSAQFVQYINELSDLPARMMLSAVICEEFNGTRARTDDETRESADGLIFSRWKNPRSKSPYRFLERPPTTQLLPIDMPVTVNSFSYANVPKGHYQTLFPSCSNCGGQHAIKNCKKATILDRKASGDQKMRGNGVPSSSGANASLTNPQVHGRPVSHGSANGWRSNELEAPMLNATHFSHHQHQQMLQNNLFHAATAAQFRAIAGYEGSPQPLFMMAPSPAPPPPTVTPQATPTNGNAN